MKKQSLTHEDFLLIKEKAEQRPRHKTEELIYSAVSEIRSFICKHPHAAFSWSGGKDSIALQYVCELAGVHECMLGISDLEYPAFLRWVTENMPQGLTVINTGLDMAWLLKNPEMLFPANSEIAGNWFRKVQHRAQRKYYAENKLDTIILGRRREDGNFVGRAGMKHYTYQNLLRYSPLADWTHEDVFAVIHYSKLPIPPFYSWPRGYRCGTHPWAARQWCESHEHAWAEIYQIDPTILQFAANYIPSAEAFLKTL
jgi:predicted phosphoadenosine phosphosulfate sulfurtransferase